MEGIAEGKTIEDFPEGTLTRDPDLWPMVGKTGAARVALQTRCPVDSRSRSGVRRCPRALRKGHEAVPP